LKVCWKILFRFFEVKVPGTRNGTMAMLFVEIYDGGVGAEQKNMQAW
jgi:hypothetical protein